MRLFSNRKRPVHLGPYPAERLPRTNAPTSIPGARPPRSPGAFEEALAPIRDLYDQMQDGETGPAPAPIPEAPEERSALLKAAAYFFDASLVGVCLSGDQYALVIATEGGAQPERSNLAAAWIEGSEEDLMALRAAEIAIVIAQFLRALGFDASAHSESHHEVPLEKLAVEAGLAVANDDQLRNPFLGTRFGLAAVTTELELELDQPLADTVGGAIAQAGIAWLLGTRGTRSALERWWHGRRPSHASRYPMEKIKRVRKPTTRVDVDEIPQVPLRASFFTRAAHGDLGAKAQAQMPNFILKEPLGASTRMPQGGLIPLQQGQPAEHQIPQGTPEQNAQAVKSLGYFLGTDLIGICEAPKYTWYSHNGRGEEITERHRYAIVLLIDQGYETMEGASGDDWISGSQSMRAYLRGSEIGSLMAAHLRKLGYRARAHSNSDGQVLQIPLILHAGLGELSRIGEVVLNPFVGPRFKSAVVTTDLPLAVDEHIDFGLQDMCDKCRKCARECPCNAISWGDKVMFNGYEMWKPDVERCTRYRLTNARGSACGRCMKTCPYNHEGLLGHQLFLSMAIHLPWTRRWIAKWDDRLGHGMRNPIKKWWSDIEIVDGVPGIPKSGVNQRDLSLDKEDPGSPVAYYNADVMPPGNRREPVPVDRKEAVQAVRLIETPAQAARRIAAGEATPSHYQPTPADDG